MPEHVDTRTKRTYDEKVATVVDLLTTMIRAVVDNETAVDVRPQVGVASIILEVVIEDHDMRHAMGRDGQMAAAMRTILNTACRKLGLKHNFSILSRDELPDLDV